MHGTSKSPRFFLLDECDGSILLLPTSVRNGIAQPGINRSLSHVALPDIQPKQVSAAQRQKQYKGVFSAISITQLASFRYPDKSRHTAQFLGAFLDMSSSARSQHPGDQHENPMDTNGHDSTWFHSTSTGITASERPMQGCCVRRVVGVVGRKTAAGRWVQQLAAISHLRLLVLWRRKAVLFLSLILPALFVIALRVAAQAVDDAFEPHTLSAPLKLPDIDLCHAWDVFNAPRGESSIPCITLAVATSASNPPPAVQAVASSIADQAGIPPSQGQRKRQRQFANADELASFMYAQPGVVDLAVVFTSWPGSQPGVHSWDYELWFNSTSAVGYQEAELDPLLPTLGVSQRRLRLQAAVDAAILAQVSGKGGASVDVTIGQMPRYVPANVRRGGDVSTTDYFSSEAPDTNISVLPSSVGFVLVLLFAAPMLTLGYLVNGFILLGIVSWEKRQGLLGQLRSWGAGEQSLWLSWLLVGSLLSAFTAIFTTIAGYSCQLLLFTKTNWLVWFLALWVFGTLMYAYFLSWSSHLSRPAYVNLLMFLSVVVCLGSSIVMGIASPNSMYSGSLTIIGRLFLYPLPWAHFSQFVSGILSVTRFRGAEGLGLEPQSFSLGDMSQKHFFNVVCGQDTVTNARRLAPDGPMEASWGELDASSKMRLWTTAMDAVHHVGTKWLASPLLQPLIGAEHRELMQGTRPVRDAAVAAGGMILGSIDALGGASSETPASSDSGHRNLASLPFGCAREDSGTVGDIVGWMFLFVLLYHALAWYLGQVASTDFTARKQPYFCFTRAFWCPTAASSSAARQHSDTLGHIQSTSASTGALMAYKVSKAYKGKTACSEISMRVDTGQATALLGVNGSGKSSFLNVLSGMTDISHGEAFVGGASVRSDMHLLRHKLAYCPQKTIVWEHLSPWEHLRLVAGVRCLEAGPAAREASALLGCVALGGTLSDASVRSFSGGMKRRVQVACAAMGPTQLMILDEPTTATDPSSKRRIWDMIQRAKRTRVVLFATHDMGEAEALSDAVAVLHGGRLKAFGSVPYLKATYAAGYTARAVLNIPMSTVMANTPLHAPMSRDLLLALGGVQSVDAAVHAAGQYGVPANAGPDARGQMLPQAAQVLEKLTAIQGVQVHPGSDGRTLRISLPRSHGDSVAPLLRQLQALTLAPAPSGKATSPTGSDQNSEEAQIMEWTLAYASLHEVFLQLSAAADAVNGLGFPGSAPPPAHQQPAPGGPRSGGTMAILDAGAPPPPPRFNPSSTVPPPGVPSLPLISPTRRQDIQFDAAGHPKPSSAGVTAQMAAFLTLRLKLEAKSWKSNCCKCCCFLVCLFLAGGANIAGSFNRGGFSNDYIVCPPGYLADPRGVDGLTDCSETTFKQRLLASNGSASLVSLLWRGKQVLSPGGQLAPRRLSPYQSNNATSMQDIALEAGTVSDIQYDWDGAFGYRLLYSDSSTDLQGGAGAPTQLSQVLPALTNPPTGASPADTLHAVRTSDLAAVGDWIPAFENEAGTPPASPGNGLGPYATTGEVLHAAQKLGRSSATSDLPCAPFHYGRSHRVSGVAALNAEVGRAYFTSYVPDTAVDFATVHAGAGAAMGAPVLDYTLYIPSRSQFLSPRDESRVAWPLNGSLACNSATVEESNPKDLTTSQPRGVGVLRGSLPAALVMTAVHSAAGKAVTGDDAFAIRPSIRFMPQLLYLSPSDTGESISPAASASIRNAVIAVTLLSWFMLCTSLVFPSLTQAMVQERSSGQHTLLKQSALHIGSYYVGWYLYCMILSSCFMFAFYGLGIALGNTVLENVGADDFFWLTFCAMHAYTGMTFIASALISRPRVALILGIIGIMAVTIAAPIITIVTQKWDNSALWIPPVAFIRAAQLVFVYGGDNINDVAGEPADLATCLGMLFFIGTLLLVIGPYLHAVIPYTPGEAARHPLFCLDPCSWRLCGVRLTELTAHPDDVQYKLAGHTAVNVDADGDSSDDVGLMSAGDSNATARQRVQRHRGACGCCCSRYDRLLSNVRQQRAVRAGEIQLQDMQQSSTTAGEGNAASDSLYATIGGAAHSASGDRALVNAIIGDTDEDVAAERTRVLQGHFDGTGTQAIPTPTLGAGRAAASRDAEGAGGAVPEGDLAMQQPVSPAGGTPPAAIVIKRLTKVYPGAARGQPNVALLDLTMAVQYGECFGLLGPNGSGKTTVLSILGGGQAATRGGAFIGGYSINTQAVAAQRVMGVVPQGDVLWNDLSVRGHLTVFARIRGVPASGTAVAARSAAEKVGLDGDAYDQAARTLSGGQKRKLSLAMALVGSPAVLLLDEPTARVDMATRGFLWEVLLRERAQRRVAIVLSTHSMLEAETLCTRVGVLLHGSLRCIGSPLHLTKRFADEYSVSVTLERAAVDAWAAEGLEAGVGAGVGMEAAVVQVDQAAGSQARVMAASAAQAAAKGASGGTGGDGSGTADDHSVTVNGVVLHVQDGPMSPADRVLNFIHSNVTPTAVLEGSVGATATVRFPRRGRLAAPLLQVLQQEQERSMDGNASAGAGDGAAHEVPMAETLAMLRAASAALGVQDWSLSQSSLEQVFMKLTAVAGDGEDASDTPRATGGGVWCSC